MNGVLRQLLQIHRLGFCEGSMWLRPSAYRQKSTGWKPRLRWGILLIFLVFTTTVATAIAQDTKQGLARPEWQLRADLEFRLACQSSLQKLCLEVVQTHQKDPSNPTSLQLISVAGSLLETTDGKLPATLPEHPASIEYVNARKAAVIEWNKAYKAKGRDLPTLAMEKERKFQESYRDKSEPLKNSTPDAKNGEATRTTASNSKNNEKKLEETTIRSLASLIKEVDKYRSTKPTGDTTLEREQSKRIAREVMLQYVDRQPHYCFTYPIKDVSGGGESLTIDVAEPMEFRLLRKELNPDLQLTHHRNSIKVTNAEILKMSSSIKPGDYLRLRFKVHFRGFVSSSDGNKMFDIKHLAVAGDPSLGDGNSAFTEISIVDVQLVKQTAKTARVK